MNAVTPPFGRRTVVVIGNGMAGQRFCERLIEFDRQRRYRIVAFCEEPRSAYDRVGLTTFFAHRDAEKLLLARREWYVENGVELHVGDRANRLDLRQRVVRSDRGVEIGYDHVVLATGSYPFVPPVPGVDKTGVFVYRTIEDLENIIRFAGQSKRCAVLGGGLLGLEAAKAAFDLGLETHVIEFAPRLMPRQIDDQGSRILVRKIESLGVHVHLNKAAKAIHGSTRVERLEFADGDSIATDMVIVSTGIRPRDELARQAGLAVGERGGIAVNDRLETSDPRVFAIGECALHSGMVYGLVAPGYEMAEIVAANLTGADRRFAGADLSTKLKLMGVDVASFGAYETTADEATPLVLEDPLAGVYKKLLFSPDGARLLGGVLVGDASDYARLSAFAKSGGPIPCQPHELLLGPGRAAAQSGLDGLPDAAQVCSCNNVSKQAICASIRDEGAETIDAVKRCTRAGTGCGGCLPLVADVLSAELKKAGKAVVQHLCEHFAYSRTELLAIIRAKELRTFDAVLAHAGQGLGCEVCKPTVASILASLWAEDILSEQHATLQDTNDRFLANLQRGGTYSVVPRIPGGEITPEKLAVIARVAKKHRLYVKITGGQRIDLFGAPVEKLPEIWDELVEAGFESGHAYGKAVRTVKSCVGSTWCRYGVQDSVGLAIRVENRYKGIRAPHKIKLAVSGCVRECAEAQSKDVGLIATEQGYNLYVGGNGGAKPRHAELLAADLDEKTALRYIDRFLMYYIMTADRLTRTSVWIEKLEGGLDHVRDVVVRDKLGIAAELDAAMQRLVDAYQCEWAAVVRDPQKRNWFRQFVNTDETEPGIEIVHERGQCRPADWPSELVSLEQFRLHDGRTLGEHQRNGDDQRQWVAVGQTGDFPRDGGATIKYGKSQIAVFNLASRGQWYATQNMCPHRKAFVLSRGIVGDAAGEPKVACPLHKKTFSLASGQSLQGEEYRIRTFPVRVEDDTVLVKLPPEEELDELLATEVGCRLATSCLSPVAASPGVACEVASA
ncbi:MAG: nitrite reductase (NAD(P)H) small subunit [Planctomycetota bacterium]|nr:MAG: nitrite reductase (NAD(P)H) small subunit [Planctomycetota bacterium]